MDIFWFVPLASVVALLFVAFFLWRILRLEEGTPPMREIAHYVAEGAGAYLRRQYITVGVFFIAGFFLLLALSIRGYLSLFVPFAFLLGGSFSAFCGFLGMMVSTKSSSRTANAAIKSLNRALRVAFCSGAVTGLTVVGLGLLFLSVGYYFLNWFYATHPLPPNLDRISAVTSNLLCFGMGASLQALFARVGGGIFTKAADVGADLVGKVELGIPEDDPRNPAVIADNVGDNVGDIAGMGADLFESYIGSIVATMALATAARLGERGAILPLLLAASGIIASILGTFLVRVKEQATQAALLAALRRAIFFTTFLIAISSFFLVKFTLGPQHLGVYVGIVCGLLVGILIGLSTEYFTSSRYSLTRSISEAARGGPGTVVIEGLSVGMLSTSIPVMAVGLAVLISFYLAGGGTNLNAGLYGVGISAVGLLSTLGITLSTDAYGPVADNAGGNAQMSGLSSEVRERTDSLDALGNTTAATGKGFAIGSAALTALALIAAYRSQLENLGRSLDLRVFNPAVIVGLFLGGMLPFLFCALTMKAVSRAASSVVKEVRRQFRQIPGLMEGRAKADYAQCVGIVTRAAQREMILPSVLALLSPLVIGVVLGVEAQASLLIGALACGFVLSLMMANSGCAWDNAKKFIEAGRFGGKGSSAHKASVVGDTVGDPLKDTSGPSLNILIKLMSMTSIVFATFIIRYSLF